MTIDEFDKGHGPFCEADKVGFDSIVTALQNMVVARSNRQYKIELVDPSAPTANGPRTMTVDEWIESQPAMTRNERARLEVCEEYLQAVINRVWGPHGPIVMLRENRPVK